MQYTVCEQCGKRISNSNLSKHLRRHELHPESFEVPKYRVTHDGLNCQFCGKECKNNNSLRNHERLCKSNPERDVSNVYKDGFNNQGRNAWNTGLTKETDHRIREQSETLSTKYKLGILTNGFKGKHHSDATKEHLSSVRTKYLKDNPDKVPYLMNHSSSISYPEKYFMELFNSENIPLRYHKQVSVYQLDFYNEDILLDVEIDGDQHYLDDKIVESDKRRTNYLESLGWKIYRVKWSDYVKLSFEDKRKVVHEIRNLLKCASNSAVE